MENYSVIRSKARVEVKNESFWKQCDYNGSIVVQLITKQTTLSKLHQMFVYPIRKFSETWDSSDFFGVISAKIELTSIFEKKILYIK